MTPQVEIVIPTYQRAHLIGAAVAAALGQSHRPLSVTVIDDGSTDATVEVLRPHRADPRFRYIRLGRNVGTAQAKNVAIALSQADALTFHDSDDRPDPDKVLRQARVLANPTVTADPVLNWGLIGREPGPLAIDLALTEHILLRADGSRFHVRRALSLVDDMFPNLQMAAGPDGDWILINPGLFRRAVFQTWGGFEACVEEDRELRNRLIMAGCALWLIPEPLLTKIEEPDSLTATAQTGYASANRARDRAMVWDRVVRWRATGTVAPVVMDLSQVVIAEASAPLTLTDVPMTAASRTGLGACIAALRARAA